ncbi:hypothetical protein Pla52o_43710 [Novipirellula galeiformis]|uniref:Fe2OG dioxygenase domain-containing protein n=1 Tax=Novipirellula galeiformis TaxID=2528004 RepID=A0A5C6C773_9BACT|nr:hypothetical protein [Novipirellula galeiformis]TWU20493.1 hypothetical protein Pla52o_43710 [Novipirellula galeiformis]
MSEPQNSAPVAEIGLIEDALPDAIFTRLAYAVRALGYERMKGNGSYTTTFWFPRDAEPTNVAEEAVVALLEQVDPGPQCIGMEWWLGRLGYGKELRLHFDQDLALKKKTDQSIHPILSSVLYLNSFPSSPTLILDQVLAPDGKSMIPEKAEFGKSVDAVPNHYVVFPGTLRHGVIPNPKAEQEAEELRLTLLVNYWQRRPLPPICTEYDGTIYATLKDVANERVKESGVNRI